MSEISDVRQAASILELRGASKIYTAQPFAGLKALNLRIQRAKVTVVAGESGSGKSTMLKLLAGYMRPDEGRVLINGEDIIPEEDPLIPGHKLVKTVSQDFNLNVYAKVYDNIATLLPNTDLKAKKQKTYELMEFLRIDHLAEKRAVDLSGGEQQRVAIARAIVKEPEVLLLDEPFSQVDAILKAELRSDIRRMARYLGITIVLVSHDPLDCLSLADELVIIKDGMVLEHGEPRKLYYAPKHTYTARLLANSNVVTREEADILGITASGASVMVYPEDIKLRITAARSPFRIKEILFKGLYNEVIIAGLTEDLIAISRESEQLRVGDTVSLDILRYLEASPEA